jgi:hypothetical protein
MKRGPRPHRRFALDHNFPAPVLRSFAMLLPFVDLVPIGDITRPGPSCPTPPLAHPAAPAPYQRAHDAWISVATSP